MNIRFDQPPMEKLDKSSSKKENIEKFPSRNIKDFGVDSYFIPKSLLEKFKKYSKSVNESTYKSITEFIYEWPNSMKRDMLFKAFVAGMENPQNIDAFLDLTIKEGGGNASSVQLENRSAFDRTLGKFLEICDTAEKIKYDFDKFYSGASKQDSQGSENLKQDLYNKAYKTLKQSLKIINEQPQEYWNDDNIEKVLSNFDTLNTEAITFSTIFKNVLLRARAERKKINFQDFEKTKLEIAQAHELTNEELEEMKELYRNNYTTPPYPKEFREALINGLYPFDEVNSHFYIVKHENNIAAFARFENIFNKEGKLESIHFGAFNLNPKYGGGLIGEEMMRQFLRGEAEHRVPINAECDPRTKISQKYLDMGFVVTGEFDFHGVPSQKIVLNPGSLKI